MTKTDFKLFMNRLAADRPERGKPKKRKMAKHVAKAQRKLLKNKRLG